MKTIYLNVEFKDPETELKAQLQKSGARNVEVRRNYNGELEVRYTIKVANPQKDIEDMLNKSGGKTSTLLRVIMVQGLISRLTISLTKGYSSRKLLKPCAVQVTGQIDRNYKAAGTFCKRPPLFNLKLIIFLIAYMSIKTFR